MNCDFDYTVLDKAIEKYGNKESSLIAVLQAAQEAYRYLPKEMFPYLSEKLKLSEAKIYGVATFYENFSLEPKGKYVLKVCDGTACHVRHSTDVLDYLRKELGLSTTKKTTDDRMFTVETVACLGACGLAPVITVNGHVYSQMTKEKAAKVLEELREGKIDA
ncbi:MAG: NAD(P)H-dependent oxidoreductase subunit E [Eubacteriales bacterium]|nr:NAD(P)H-dependent oxidoreductase subunit E [Eubacteriales bacterium]